MKTQENNLKTVGIIDLFCGIGGLSHGFVKEKFNVLADNFILYKVLLGDNSDKVPGVKGLGEKGLLKKFPELANEVLTLDDIFRISEEKHKDHIVYTRIAFERERLEQNYRIMDLKKPLLDDNDKLFLEAFAEEENITLNSEDFLRFYHDDGLGHLIKNVDFWIKDTFKVLNSFK